MLLDHSVQSSVDPNLRGQSGNMHGTLSYCGNSIIPKLNREGNDIIPLSMLLAAAQREKTGDCGVDLDEQSPVIGERVGIPILPPSSLSAPCRGLGTGHADALHVIVRVISLHSVAPSCLCMRLAWQDQSIQFVTTGWSC